ncbi:hypothetical protein A3C32_04400 [Candidatus Daviesbacteria bacterium RIFCSPHIGHO2_02_FULL_41_14]|uniref:Glycosyltransferase 2-like domain-containing protein n=1 Tax=Candidatus Daviesbacteria bacterium RIFCSPLOWO2_01_FULL_40_24 TaxID=1797787 RepID=A0A1F5MJD5_9BACT|nr:MAG: hypothetical protein A3C32_04400 [Candidatus Daviesbacteria bacterium RIFCSPHIGHO2_02_FULL_41_14]OGE65468.1 MAG: hypothetical protein A3B49_01095 [Candidatus Daviesbacteria bacterium RIFCSPLOWO2_01_FULL_40_24]
MSDINLVSVIVTTRNEELVIERLLKSIKHQTYKKIEVILVDNKSTDKTKQIARKYTTHIYDYGPERSAQRNLGLKKANGEMILFLDADMELKVDLIEKSVKLFKTKQIDAIVIPEQSVASNIWEQIKAYERFFYNRKGDPITDAARFFKKKVLDKIGGYDTSITGPEDWDLPERVKKSGYQIGRVRSLIYHYERIPSLVSLLRKKYYYGLGTHSYLKKNSISLVGAKTVYFLRPVFYKQWKILISNPKLTILLIYVLGMETLCGGFGYLIGRIKYSKNNE